MNTVSGKGFVEKSETAVKTNNSALLSEYNIPNADLSHSEYIQESQNTNHYANSKQPTPNGDSERRLEPLSFGNVQNGGGKSGDIGFYGEIGVKNQTLETKAFPQEVEKHTNRYDLRKQTTSNDGSEWRQEQLSFGNAKNGGGKSGDLGFHGEVGVKNEILETKAFPQEVEKPFKGNNTEKLMFGMSQSGGGKMNSEPEYPTTAIQKVNLLAVESVPLLKSPANRNFNFSERSSEKPQMEKHEDEQLPNNVQTSEAAVIEKVDPSVLDEKNFQEETMVYWRRPSILEQNTHTQLPKRLETVRATDVKPSKEWEKMESNSSVGQSTSGEINSDITFDSQLVKSPTKNKVTLNNSIEKTTAELPTSNVEAPAKAKVSLKTSVEKTNELPTSNEEALVKVKPVYSLEKTRSKLSALNDSFLEFTPESKASASVQKSDKLISPTNDEPAEIKSLSEKRNREFVHYPKPNILQQKANIMPISLSSEKRNVDPAVPEQVMSPDSQNKHNFKVLTFKERLNETPTVPLSNPKQFQSLRNFWGTKDKSLSKPEISLRRARNLHGSKDSGFVKLETNLGHTAPDGSLNQDKWSFSEESHISPREWYKKAAEPSEIVPSRVDVVETVNKAFVPSKSENDAFKSSLERLGKESAKNSDDSENKLERTLSLPNPEAGTLKTEIQNKSLEDKSQPPQESFYDLIKRRSQNLKDHQKVQEIQHPEVRETAGQENAPRLEDSNELKVNLEKAQKESLVANSPFTQTSEITFPVPKSASMPVLHSPFSQSRDKILPEEIEEIIEKVAVPPKADLPESSVGLQKLLVEASVIGPLSSKVTQNEEAVKPEPQSIFENVNYSFPEVQKQVRLDLEEVKENVSKMEAPEKVEFSAFNSGLDKLYKEAAVFLPVPMNTIYTKKKIDTIITNQDPQIFKQGVLKPSPERGSLSSQQRQSPAEVNETVAKTTILPKVDTSAFDEGLAKLLQEAMYSANSGQSVENQSSLPDSSAYSSDYNLSVKKPTFSQVDVGKEREKLSRDVDLRNDTPVSETPNTKVVFHQKIVPTNGPPASSELYFDKENRNLEVTYPEVDDEYLRNEEADNEDLVAGAGFMSDARSGGFVRASTPVKEGGVCVKQSTLELKLSPPPNENMSGSLGSGLSDENADSYTENWKNSSHSEEDSNLVLSVLRRSANKPASSKSLEDISSAASMPEKVDVPKEESVRNAENGSTLPAYPDNRFQDPEKLKRLSKSVPDFLQDESDDRETDSTSEGSFPLGRHKKTPSSLTNLSGSSGMASLSSVSGSVMSIYSGDFGNLDIKGNIQFAIDYVEQLHEFHIFVAQCKELAVADEKKQRSDPYVKSYLLPGKEKMGKRKTAVRKKTLNPAYNEILRYKINKPVLLTQKLNLSVWHNDTFGRNSFLGEVDIDLATWDWSNKHMNWYALQPRTPAAGIGLENRGEMSIALKYTTTPASGKKTASSGEVHIWVKSCSNLPVLRGNRINSFVKCTVLPDTSRKSRQKTRSVDKTTNPVFNHTMVYDGFRAEDLREACVELTVWDHNRLANHFLGGLRLGLGSGKSYGTPVDWMDSTAYESSLWKKMINMPNEWVEDTLQLRMLMMAKMSK